MGRDESGQGAEPMSTNLAAAVAQHVWHHAMDLGGGVVTAGHKPLDVCKAEADIVFSRIDLRGRSVLDVGAWTGYFSFEAERQGARHVLATDSYCWQHPTLRGKAAFDLARTALGARVEARMIDPHDVSPDSVGNFNVVLFLGVFYHLYDPIAVLAKVASVATDVLVIETHLDLRRVPAPAMRFYPGTELAGDPTNWWGPNERLVETLLLGHGFTVIETAASPDLNRAIFFAWRSTDARLAPLAEIDRLKPSRIPFWQKIVREIRRPFRHP
jgi:tRNA (mo5U34)-methyltransferase